MKVFIIAAITADGYIAKYTEHTADWTSPEDKQLFKHLTKAAGVMVMGSKTFATIGRALPGRRTIVITSHPEKITADGIEVSNESPKQLIKRLQSEGNTTIAICGGASVYTQFMQAGVVHELYLSIEPQIFGQGVTLFSEAMDIKLSLMDSRPLNQHTLLLHYQVN